MKTKLLIVLIGILLFTVVSAFFSHSKSLAMDIQFNVKDLPEHGLRIIKPSDSSFDITLASSNLPDVSSEIIKSLSIFIQNTGQHSVVAYMLRWELTDGNGKTVRYNQAYSSPLFLMEEWGIHKPVNYQGAIINPNSAKFFSLIPPEKNDLRAVGGYSGTQLNQSDLLQGSNQKPSREKTIKGLVEELNHLTSITVSIDGVFFDDGTFVGPDDTNFFAKFKARYDARRDLYKEVLLKIQSKEPVNKVFDYVEALSRDQQVESKPNIAIERIYDIKSLAENNSLDRPSYSIARAYKDSKQLYAREIVRQSQRMGSQETLETIQSHVAKPWAPLRKLQASSSERDKK